MKTMKKSETTIKLNMETITGGIDKTLSGGGNSTARYFTFDTKGERCYSHVAVCYHGISDHCPRDGEGGLGIAFQGYGGFRSGLKDRAAKEADLYTNQEYPFMVNGTGYTQESLEWLKGLLDPQGPFKTLLPCLLETKPEEIQARRAFIFPDTSSIPARLAWCFAIASRIGYSNARVLWRYLHLLEKGLDRRTAMLIAGGYEHQIKDGKPTGKLIKSYTCGFLGVDVTAYAGRFLASDPIVDEPSAKRNGTYNSSDVFKSGKIDMKNMIFEDWDEVISYTQARGLEQTQLLKAAA